jgi:methylmalonyl-CoA mutase C-terminal domain/subunit
LKALGVEVFPPGSQLDDIVGCARRLTGISQ